MRRLHLFELEDLDWVPRVVRDGGTDLLDLSFAKMGFYDGVVPKLTALLGTTHASRIVDLCSGGGGAALTVRRLLRAAGDETELVLTDRHPNAAGVERVRALGDARTTYRAEPVDALSVPTELAGVRTMSGALHHFPPDAVRGLLSSIVAQRAPLAFFDVAASPAIRKMPIVFLPIAMSVNMLILTLATLALTPLARPFRISRLLLTYLVPVIPALVAWDGTVSALRAYTPDEVLELARSVPGGDGYAWDAGVVGSALYLTGTPRPGS